MTLPRPIGAHMSISGGLDRAVFRAASVGASALQIFTKNQVQWVCRPLGEAEIGAFRTAVRERGIRYVYAHAGYLINLASDNPDTRRKSLDLLALELARAEVLGCDCLIMHPGSPRGDGFSTGVERVSTGILTALAMSDTHEICLALENTAGQGATLGRTLTELGEIIDACDRHPRIGLCLDTCHAFTAGYDLRDPDSLDGLIKELSGGPGSERLKVIHLNDSRDSLASRRDRHEHIGKGTIGLSGFSHILRHPALAGIPGIIETPKDAITLEEDRRNLRVIAEIECRGAHLILADSPCKEKSEPRKARTIQKKKLQ